MKKAIISIIMAVILIIAGGIICMFAFLRMGKSLAPMSFAEMETAEVQVTEEFHDISATVDTGNISIGVSEDGACKVVCYQDKKAPFEVSVEKGALCIDEKKRTDLPWYEQLSILADMPSAVVFLPADTYGSLLAQTDTGKISIGGELSFESISLSSETGDLNIEKTVCGGDIIAETDTGNIYITEASCTDLKITGETTYVHLDRVLASKSIDVVSDTGNISFDDSDAPFISAQTDTGNIEGTLLSGKRFEAGADTGRVDVPKDDGDDVCKLKTDTGNIRIRVSE